MYTCFVFCKPLLAQQFSRHFVLALSVEDINDDDLWKMKTK